MKPLRIALLSVLLVSCSHDQRPAKPAPAKSRSDGEQALRDAIAHTNKSPRRK